MIVTEKKESDELLEHGPSQFTVEFTVDLDASKRVDRERNVVL